MGIGWAMQQLKFANRVTRPHWVGWLEMTADDPPVVNFNSPDVDPAQWTPSNDDLLTLDWQISP